MRYQYQSQGFQNDYFGFKNKFQNSPIKLIIALNILIYLLTNGQWSFINYLVFQQIILKYGNL